MGSGAINTGLYGVSIASYGRGKTVEMRRRISTLEMVIQPTKYMERHRIDILNLN
jgi:hypothetical protein